MSKVLVNSDKRWVEEVRAKIKENDGYCPCKLIKSDDTKCMCKDFRELEEGYCECGLHLRIKNNED